MVQEALAITAPSSNGLGQRSFKPLIAGSNPRGVIGEGIMPNTIFRW